MWLCWPRPYRLPSVSEFPISPNWRVAIVHTGTSSAKVLWFAERIPAAWLAEWMLRKFFFFFFQKRANPKPGGGSWDPPGSRPLKASRLEIRLKNDGALLQLRYPLHGGLKGNYDKREIGGGGGRSHERGSGALAPPHTHTHSKAPAHRLHPAHNGREMRLHSRATSGWWCMSVHGNRCACVHMWHRVVFLLRRRAAHLKDAGG